MARVPKVLVALALVAVVVVGNTLSNVYDYESDKTQEIWIEENRTAIDELTVTLEETKILPRIEGLPQGITILPNYTFVTSPRQPKFDNDSDFDCIIGFGENSENLSRDFRDYLLRNSDNFTYKGNEIILNEKIRPDVFIAPIVKNGEITGIVWILDRGDSPPQVRYLEETYEKLNTFKGILERLCLG